MFEVTKAKASVLEKFKPSGFDWLSLLLRCPDERYRCRWRFCVRVIPDKKYNVAKMVGRI